MAQPFVIDGICHPYTFSEENLKGRFGRIFNDVLYAFHPLLNPADTALSKEEWQHDWQNDEFLETMLLESETDMACVHSVPVYDAVETLLGVEEVEVIPRWTPVWTEERLNQKAVSALEGSRKAMFRTIKGRGLQVQDQSG